MRKWKRALIVDDNMDNRLLLSAILNHFDLQQLEAHNGEEAVQIYEQLRPELVLMDIRMPGLSGYEAVEIIREIETVVQQAPSTIIGLTAIDLGESRDEERIPLFDHFLQKPISVEQLITLLKNN